MVGWCAKSFPLGGLERTLGVKSSLLQAEAAPPPRVNSKQAPGPVVREPFAGHSAEHTPSLGYAHVIQAQN